MTRTEAIKKIKSLCHYCDEFPHCVNTDPDCFKALEMAIKALEQEPCDCISRAEVIEINKKYHGQMPNDINHQIWQELNDLPSIQPKSKTDVLDKIIAEIKTKYDSIPQYCNYDYGWIDALEWIASVIDKYTAESEE